MKFEKRFFVIAGIILILSSIIAFTQINTSRELEKENGKIREKVKTERKVQDEISGMNMIVESHIQFIVQTENNEEYWKKDNESIKKTTLEDLQNIKYRIKEINIPEKEKKKMLLLSDKVIRDVGDAYEREKQGVAKEELLKDSEELANALKIITEKIYEK